MLWLPSNRWVRGASGAAVTWQAYDADGEPVAPPSGTVAVSVVDSEGNTVTAGSVTQSSTGPSTATIAADEILDVDWITATWTLDGTAVHEQTYEVVGGTIGTVGEITANSALSVNAPDRANVLAARKAVEDQATRIMHRRPFLSFYTERIDGSGRCDLRVSWPDVHEVVWVKVWTSATTSTSFTAAQIAACQPQSTGTFITRTDGNVWPCGSRNIEIGYRYGWTSIPHDLRVDLHRAVRHRVGQLTSTGVPDRATSMTTFDDTTYNLATPGLGPWSTGLPDVDEKLNGYRYAVMVA